MKILCNKQNVIVAIGDVIEFGTFEDEQKWKIAEHLFMMDDSYTLYEIEEQEVETFKHCYNQIDGVYLNPNWSEPIDEIARLKEEINTLTECLLEMSEIVYGG